MEIIILKPEAKIMKEKNNHQTTADKNKTELTKLNNHKSSVFIVGDSMVKNVNGFKLTGKVAHKRIIKLRQFSGAKTSCMKVYIKPIIREKNPEHIVLQIGINDLNSSKTPAEIAEEIVDLAYLVKTNSNNISTPGLVPQADKFNNKAEGVNKSLKKMCGDTSLQFINH